MKIFGIHLFKNSINLNLKNIMNENCVFCKKSFPDKNQQIDNTSKYWEFLHSINPICDFHCLLILKKEVINNIGRHINDISDCILPQEVVTELGILLNKASVSIKKCDENIERVNVISLNSWENSKHLHFHLIPIYKWEKIKKVNNVNMDGSWLNFWSRKEIIQDTLNEFITQTCWESAYNILSSINTATLERVSRNTEILKKNFKD